MDARFLPPFLLIKKFFGPYDRSRFASSHLRSTPSPSGGLAIGCVVPSFVTTMMSSLVATDFAFIGSFTQKHHGAYTTDSDPNHQLPKKLAATSKELWQQLR
jgi:hypothetical protein